MGLLSPVSPDLKEGKLPIPIPQMTEIQVRTSETSLGNEMIVDVAHKLTVADGIPPQPMPATAGYPHITRTIDWRNMICHLLDLPPLSTDNELIDGFQAAQDKLKEAERIRRNPEASQVPPRSQVINTIKCASSGETSMYLGEPWAVQTGPHDAHLRGSQHVADIEVYLALHKETILLVHRDYECCGDKPPSVDRSRFRRGLDVDVASMLTREYVSIVSPKLKNALIDLSNEALQDIPHPEFDTDEDDLGFSFPYLWYYHRRQQISEARLALDETCQEHLNVLQDYISNRMSHEWREVDSLLSNSKIKAQYLVYLYVSLKRRTMSTH